MFNEMDLFNRAHAPGGDLLAILTNSHAPGPSNNQPPGVVSCTYRYVERRPSRSGTLLNSVAVVHQYENPDGTIAASGKPDPKSIRVGDTLFIAIK
jgi:hypothetical protein